MRAYSSVNYVPCPPEFTEGCCREVILHGVTRFVGKGATLPDKASFFFILDGVKHYLVVTRRETEGADTSYVVRSLQPSEVDLHYGEKYTEYLGRRSNEIKCLVTRYPELLPLKEQILAIAEGLNE